MDGRKWKMSVDYYKTNKIETLYSWDSVDTVTSSLPLNYWARQRQEKVTQVFSINIFLLIYCTLVESNEGIVYYKPFVT